MNNTAVYFKLGWRAYRFWILNAAAALIGTTVIISLLVLVGMILWDEARREKEITYKGYENYAALMQASEGEAIATGSMAVVRGVDGEDFVAIFFFRWDGVEWQLSGYSRLND